MILSGVILSISMCIMSNDISSADTSLGNAYQECAIKCRANQYSQPDKVCYHECLKGFGLAR